MRGLRRGKGVLRGGGSGLCHLRHLRFRDGRPRTSGSLRRLLSGNLPAALRRIGLQQLLFWRLRRRRIIHMRALRRRHFTDIDGGFGLHALPRGCLRRSWILVLFSLRGRHLRGGFRRRQLHFLPLRNGVGGERRFLPIGLSELRRRHV